MGVYYKFPYFAWCIEMHLNLNTTGNARLVLEVNIFKLNAIMILQKCTGLVGLLGIMPSH